MTGVQTCALPIFILSGNTENLAAVQSNLQAAGVELKVLKGGIWIDRVD